MRAGKPAVCATGVSLTITSFIGVSVRRPRGSSSRLRYTGSITFPTSGSYTLVGAADDVIRVKLNGVQVLSGGGSVNIPTVAGSYPIEIEFVEIGGGASWSLSWIVPGGTIVLDDYGLAVSQKPLLLPQYRKGQFRMLLRFVGGKLHAYVEQERGKPHISRAPRQPCLGRNKHR